MNQINETNQINQIDQINVNGIGQTNRPQDYPIHHLSLNIQHLVPPPSEGVCFGGDSFAQM